MASTQPEIGLRHTNLPNSESTLSGVAENPLEAQEMEADHLEATSDLGAAETDDYEGAFMLHEAADPTNHPRSEYDWTLFLTKRQIKAQKRGLRNAAILKNGEPQAGANNGKMAPASAVTTSDAAACVESASAPNSIGGRATQRPRQRAPPLPKNDAKIIIRPKDGLPVKALQGADVAKAIGAACGNKIRGGKDFIIRLRLGSNIIIASTPSDETAKIIRGITSLSFGGRSFQVNTYVATPEDCKRAVIHGIDAGTTEEELMENLTLRTQGVTILGARMLGKSKTALITFDGPFIPRMVNWWGGEYKCHPYRPTRQVCYNCGQQGHRSDVCPTPDAKACRQCGARNPPEGHQCQPKCLVCGGDHATGSRDCKERLKQFKELRGPAYGGRQSRQKSRSGQQQQQQQQQQHRKRWLSSEGDHSQSRNQSQERRGSSRSRSRNRSRSRSRTNAPQSSQGIKGGKQQPQQQRHQKKQKPNNNTNNGKDSQPGRVLEESSLPFICAFLPLSNYQHECLINKKIPAHFTSASESRTGCRSKRLN
ncbi:uncharacterized protein [Dermacentor albipictus]|uniref:uncharacterized protein n=1 Tax=Dermacentor albipictus TaxID=60249 RepID=UPI0031FD689E